MTSEDGRPESTGARRRLLVGGLVGVCALICSVTGAAPSFASGGTAAVHRVAARSVVESSPTGLPGASVGKRYDAPLPFAGRPASFWVKEYDETVQEPASGSVLGLAEAPPLPAGLALDGRTGHLLGTPTEAGTFRFTVYADIAHRSVARAFTITITGAPVAASTVLAPGTAGSPYRTTVLTISDAPVSYQVASGSLPGGLSLDGATGVVSGTPTASGRTVLRVRATNADGSTLMPLTLDIAAATSTPAPPLTVPQMSWPKVRFGHRFAVSEAANSTLPVTYSITDGPLPRGLHLDPDTGLVSGFPTQSWPDFGDTVTATSTAGTTSAYPNYNSPRVEKLIHRVHVPATFVGSGRVPIVFKGLQKGERWQLRQDGAVERTGRATHAGTLSTSVLLKRAPRDRVHTFVLSASRRVSDPAVRAATSFASPR